ncbi:MAG: DUF488 domain-containing protein [Alphaproteobacteria bacterium]|nr:DUF488 domain-containing protein [Alphaproteobacteria bacterium]
MSGAGDRPGQVLTVGHSNHAPEAFLALLTRHGVTALADVRSAPRSRFNPQFNRKALSASLADNDIAYVWLGRELGGRPDDPACYEDGTVHYDLLARTPLYQEGIGRVLRGAAVHRLALMCAEKDPLHCHRTLLVSRSLEDEGLEVAHILADGALESHESVMDRLLAAHHEDLFSERRSRAGRIEEAARTPRRRRKRG